MPKSGHPRAGAPLAPHTRGGPIMSAELVAETIERWVELIREYEAEGNQQGAERMRNWLFGAGLALQLLDDPALIDMALRALEEPGKCV